MQTEAGAFHPTRFRDLAVTVEFHCDSACRFCIVQEGMNRFKGVPFEKFREMVDENKVSRKYDRVLFTGGEVTLENKLFPFLEYARDSGSFRAMRVQTNGRRLADEAFTAKLVDAGVNEYFVSIHGSDAAIHDDITQRSGSFAQLVQGLANLAKHPVRRLTNTVVNRRNLKALPGIVPIALAHGVEKMEFWNYLPMEDAADERNLIAPMSDAIPPLLEALDLCRDAGLEAVVKYFPRCLLGEHASKLDNGQPDVIIVESFWDQFPKFNCLYEATCEHSEECLGLHHPYVNKFGWEENRLHPAPRTHPWAERSQAAEARPDESASASKDRPALVHPAWRSLVGEPPPETASRLDTVQLTRNQARYRYELNGGGSVELVLAAREESEPALARSKSFNIFYVNAQPRGREKEMTALLTAAVREIQARDVGELSLDPRKGLDRSAVRLHALGRSRSS